MLWLGETRIQFHSFVAVFDNVKRKILILADMPAIDAMAFVAPLPAPAARASKQLLMAILRQTFHRFDIK